MATLDPTPQDEAGRSRAQGRALLFGTIAFFTCFYAWSLLGPLGPDLQDHLGLSELELSVMVAVPVILGSLMRIPMGILTDIYGGRRVFTALIAFTLLPLVGLAAWHDSYAGVLMLGFLLGFAGSSFAIGVPFVNKWFEADRQGFALGIYGMGMGGTVLGGLTAPKIVDVWGLTAPFLVAAGALALVGVGFALLARDASAPGGGRLTAQRLTAPLAVFRRSRKAWALTLFYFLTFGGFVAMFLYLPKLLTGVHDLTKTDAGARAAGFALLAVLARPVGGWLADRVTAERVLRWSFAATIVLALVLAAFYEDMVPLTIACLSLAVAFGLGTGAVFKLVAAWFPREVGAVTGVVGAAGGLGGFFPPLVMAIVNEATGSYTLGFVLLAAVGGVALGVLAAVARAGREKSADATAVPA